MKVVIHQFGELETVTAAGLAEALAWAFGIEAAAEPVEPVPSGAYDAERGQFSSRAILAELASRGKGPASGGEVLLGVTAVDLFVPKLNFVFGEADTAGGVAVVSVHRLRPRYYGEAPDAALLAERFLKEAIHELGHVFGLRHCPRPECIMHFSNTVADTDRKGPGFCEDHARELSARGVQVS